MSRIRAEPVHAPGLSHCSYQEQPVHHTPPAWAAVTELQGTLLPFCSMQTHNTWVHHEEPHQIPVISVKSQHRSKPRLNSHTVWAELRSSQDLPSPTIPHGKSGLNCLLLKSSLYFIAYWRTGQEKEILKEYLHISISWSLWNITILSLHTAVDQGRQAQTQFLTLSNISTERAR